LARRGADPCAEEQNLGAVIAQHTPWAGSRGSARRVGGCMALPALCFGRFLSYPSSLQLWDLDARAAPILELLSFPFSKLICC